MVVRLLYYGVNMSSSKLRRKSVSYAKWGYIFLIPFVVTFCIFSLYPLGSTIVYGFFESFRDPDDFTKMVGPNFVGLQNFKTMFADGFKSDCFTYLGNTAKLWVVGFVPQLFFSLLLAKWFTDLRLKLKATGFFKVVIYMPNVIMASSMALLFFSLFDNIGPVNQLLKNMNVNGGEGFRFFSSVWGTRGIIAAINFIMWYGNTTILLMAAIMGVDTSLYESAQIDGASPSKIFFKITLPLITPILVFVVITSMLGGIQMFDVPYIMTQGRGDPMRSSFTLIMQLNNYMHSDDVGRAGALSIFILAVSIILSVIVFKFNTRGYKKER